MFKATTLTVDNLEVNILTSEGIEDAASKLVVLDDIDNTTDMSINGVIIQDAVTMEMMAEKLMDFFFFGLDLLPNFSVV